MRIVKQKKRKRKQSKPLAKRGRRLEEGPEPDLLVHILSQALTPN
jgi:hypothetical protein